LLNRPLGLLKSLAPKLRVLRDFLLAQGLTLVGNLFYGLLCIRLLPTASYAKFVVLFGVQGTLVVLMDVGISTSLVPLIGERVDDRGLIADYVATLRGLGRQLYGIVVVGLIIAYPLLVKNRGWSWQTVVAMIGTLMVSTWFMRIGATYGTVLLVLRDRHQWYLGQMISSLGTLALLLMFWAFHELYAFTAILLNVAGIVFVGCFYFYRSRKLLGNHGVPSKAKRKAILRLALPNFGKTTGVASMGALARLGQIFALAGQINPIIVEPYFARLSKDRFARQYLIAVSLCISLGATVVFASYLFPGAFLWVLGPKYAELHFEVVLVMMSSAVATLSGLVWTIHSSRKFVFWWTNILNIVLIFCVQLMFIMRADLGQLRSLLWMAFGTNLASLTTDISAGIYGFIKGPRKVEDDLPQVSLEETENAESRTGFDTVLVYLRGFFRKADTADADAHLDDVAENTGQDD
jgi:O-antigen/teichoic acid export membrane protein